MPKSISGIETPSVNDNRFLFATGTQVCGEIFRLFYGVCFAEVCYVTIYEINKRQHITVVFVGPRMDCVNKSESNTHLNGLSFNPLHTKHLDIVTL